MMAANKKAKIKNTTEEFYQSVIKLYNDGKSIKYIQEIYNQDPRYIQKILKNNKIEIRSAQSYNRKSNLKFWDKPPTNEAEAYFLGLMYADGNNFIGKNNHSYEVCLSLKEEDKYIVEKLRNFISPASPIKIKSVINIKSITIMAKLGIDDKKLSEQLTTLGCMPNKSLKLQFPTFLTDKMLSHFIRGYLDGDGCIYGKPPKLSGQVDFGMQITSTDMFCFTIDDIIQSKFNITGYIKICNPEYNLITTTLSYGGNRKVIKILDWLYQDATLFLTRKYDIYLRLKAQNKKIDERKEAAKIRKYNKSTN